MKAIRRILRDESGSILVAVSILAIVMLIVVLSIYEFASGDSSLASRRVDRSRALYLAESGLARAHTWLEAQYDPPPGVTVLRPFGAFAETLSMGTYRVSILPDIGNPAAALKFYTIRCTGSSGSDSLVLERDVMTHSYAQFIYFTEEEHPPQTTTPVWFCSADMLDGSLHTNGQIHILGDPHFAGHVSSAYGGPDDTDPSHTPSFMYYNGSRYDNLESSEPNNAPYDEPIFDDGYELGTSDIELPDCVDNLIALANDGGVTITGDAEIVLSRETGDGRLYGYVSYRDLSGGEWTDVELSSFNGILYVSGEISVAGVLDGTLTIATGGDMCIVDDVTYRASDAEGPLDGCDDVLGLVSESNVIIMDNSANADDCTVHAHIMALGTSFEVENYASGSPRGTLTIHGGIIQRYRGCVGTGYLSGDEIIIYSGFAKSYNYDTRFENVQPPGYFMTGRYYKRAWREVDSA